MHEISCGSRIASVDVFARGAVVTREVTLPEELPSDEVDIVVPGITRLLQPGTLRAESKGDRALVYVRARAIFPSDVPVPAELVERVRSLERDIEMRQIEQGHLYARREMLHGVRPEPELNVRWRRIDPEARVSDALAALSLASDLTGSVERRLAALDDELMDLGKHLERARLELAEAGDPAREGKDRVTHTAVVRLAAGARPESLTISYAVPAARWWPVYSAHFSTDADDEARGPRAAWTLEAFVVQATGEDWREVRLGLTTAELRRDAQLPELLSVRLARKQPPPRRAFRPLPQGLRDMFSGYDEACARVEPPAPPPPKPPPRPRTRRAKHTLAMAPAPALDQGYAAADDDVRDPSVAMQRHVPLMASFAPEPEAMDAMAASAAIEDMPTMVGGGGTELTPGDAWLDFDALVLAPMDDRDLRGRLTKETSVDVSSAEEDHRVDMAPMPEHAIDVYHRDVRAPQVRYQADAPVEIPSDAAPHRVPVAVAAGTAEQSLLTLPRESLEVYREARQKNPFAGKTLLPGPVDVFLDGTLLVTSRLALAGEGGTLRLGLGVDERIRVARNVRTEEETVGLLGGKTQIVHDVSIELSSSLGYTATVTVHDRMPVTEDTDVEIVLVSANPRPSHYDQADRGAPVRGGLAWEITLAAGGTARIGFSYAIVLPGKHELEGGNRRE